jgi:ArsR family transcriptional regulator, arsenate/arsenite/antimonite-responsive transcriptional repressor
LKLTERPWRESSCCPTQPTARPLDDGKDTVELLKSLADETRLGIVRLLAAHGEPLCVCHIVDAFDLSQPTISHHLRLLREAGLITSEKRGLWAYYSLDTSRLSTLGSALPLALVACTS